MADTKIGAAYIEVLTKGISAVQSDLNKVRDQTTEVGKPVTLPVAANVEAAKQSLQQLKSALSSTQEFATSLQQQLSNTPLSLALQLDKSRGDIVAQVKKDVEGLPKEARVAFVAEKIDAVQAEIQALEAELARLPEEKKIKATVEAAKAPEVKPPDVKAAQAELNKLPARKTILARLEFAKSLKGDLQKTLDSVKAPGVGKAIADSFTMAGAAAATAIGKLTSSVEKIGPIASKSFLVGAAGITGFVRAADPAGFMKLQGTLAQLSVQIGSIFLPLMDMVSKALQTLLEFFRGLSNEQKDSISKWVGIGLAVAAVLAILPKLLTGFSLITTAIKVMGATLALSTGGLSVLLGAVAMAIPLLLSLFGSMDGGEGLGGAFAGIGDSLSSLVSSVTAVFGRVAEVAMAAFEKLKPVLLELVNTIGTIFKQLVPIIGQLVTVLAGIIEKLIPIFAQIIGTVLTIVGKIATALSAVLGPVLELVGKVITTVASVLFPVLETVGTVVNRVLEAFTPLVNMVLGMLVPIITLIATTFSSLMDALQPVISAVTDVANIVLETVAPAFEMFASILGVAISIVSAIFETLVEALKPVISVVVDLLTPAFEFIGMVVKAIGDAIKRVVNGIIDFMNSFFEWYNDQDWLPGRFDLIKRIGEDDKKDESKVDTLKKEKEKKEEKKAPGRHAPTQAPKMELIGLVDAWRKAQTSTAQTPEQKAAEEQRRLMEESNKEQKKQTELLEGIKDKKNDGSGGFDI